MANKVSTISQDLAKLGGDQHCKKCGKPSGQLNVCPECIQRIKDSTAPGGMLDQLKAEVAKDKAKAARKATKDAKEGKRVDMRSAHEIMWDDELSVPERVELCKNLGLDSKIASKAWAELGKCQEIVSRPKTINGGVMPKIEDKPSETGAATGKAKKEARGRAGRAVTVVAGTSGKKVGEAKAKEAATPTMDYAKFLADTEAALLKLLPAIGKAGKTGQWFSEFTSSVSKVCFSYILHTRDNPPTLGVELLMRANRDVNEKILAKLPKAELKKLNAVTQEHWGRTEDAPCARIRIDTPIADVTPKDAADTMVKLYKLCQPVLAKIQ